MASKYYPYVDGNFFLIDKYDYNENSETWELDTAGQYEGLAKEQKPRTASKDSTVFFFDQVNGLSGVGLDVVDDFANPNDFDTPLFADRAAWDTFYRNNLGKSSAGDSALTSDELYAIQDANNPNADNPFATMEDIVGGTPFDPSAYDLTEFTNDNADPFARMSDVVGGGLPYGTFTFMALATGTNNPTIYQAIGDNTLGFTPTLERFAEGQYKIISPLDNFVFGKASCFAQSSYFESTISVDPESAAPDFIVLLVNDPLTGLLKDGFFAQITINIWP